MSPILFGLLGYVAVQFAIGAWVGRRVTDEADYLLAGRRLGLPLVAFSVFATWFGAESVVGAAGAVYSDGLSGGSADPFGYALCLVGTALIFAAPLWRRNYTTFGDLFRERYSPGVERLTVLLLVPTSVIWAAAQVRAFGQVVSAASPLEVDVAIAGAAFVVVAYTLMGGLMADAVTDLIQGVALTVGLVVIFVAVVRETGGLGAGLATIDPARFRPLALDGRPGLEVLEAWVVPVCGSMLAVEVLSRVMGASSARVARNGTLIGAGLYLLVGLIPVYLGLVGPALVPGLTDGEQVVPQLAQRYLSPLGYVVFAGALISTILSTVDSALLAASGLLSHNFVLRLAPGVGERGKLLAARAGVALLGALAFLLALSGRTVDELVELASAFGSAGIFVVAVLGLFTRVGGAVSAYAALVSGALVWLHGSVAGWSAPYVVALGASTLVYLAVAVLAPRSTPAP